MERDKGCQNDPYVKFLVSTEKTKEKYNIKEGKGNTEGGLGSSSKRERCNEKDGPKEA